MDCKIADALLKKGTKQHADGWDAPSKAWAHMVLHLTHAEGGFGVTFNDATKDAAFYTTTARFVAWLGAFSQERQKLWLPKDDLQDYASWSSPPLVLLRDIHNSLLANYDCKDTAPPQSQPGTGARVGRSQQDGDAQQQEAGPLLIPQLNGLHQANIVRGKDDSNVAAIPTQNRLTHQILSMWQHFKDLKQTFAVSRRAEQLRLREQQRVVATVEYSVLGTEMASLESQEEDAPRRVLWFKPMSWLGQIRPHHRDEAWSASLWQTFFASCVGANIPALAELRLSACGCRKFQIDTLWDHLCTCSAHSGAKKADDWAVEQRADLFRTSHKVKTQQVAKSLGQRCGDIELGGYLANVAGPVPLVLDLRIAHERWGSSSYPNINGHLHYANDVDRSLNEAAADKIRKYRADYNKNPPNAISFMPAIASTSGRLHSKFVRLLILQAHRETERFFAASAVQLPQSNRCQFHYRRAAFFSQLKSKVGNILAKASALRITLNIDGAPIALRSHTHPSHSQTSRLLTSSLSLGAPVPRATQCMRGV